MRRITQTNTSLSSNCSVHDSPQLKMAFKVTPGSGCLRERKVSIDTFSSMKHQVKVDELSASLVGSVIEALSASYAITTLAVPELEPHEEV